MSATAALLVISARARSSPSGCVAAMYVPMSMSLRASAGTSRPSKAPPAISRWRARTVPCAVCARLSALAFCATSRLRHPGILEDAHAGARGGARPGPSV